MLGQLNLQGKDMVEVAIERIKTFEPPEGYYLAFSGGKDSVVIKRLCEMAGVKFDAHYNITTVDAPELVQFVKSMPDVQMEKARYDDGSQITMWNLIPKKRMPPTRIVRYCCKYLKEGMIKKGFITLFAVLIMAVLTLSFDTEAKTVKRYATKTVNLKERPNTKSKTVCKVKRGKKLTVIKTGKKWAKVKYKGKTLRVQKKYLNDEGLPSANMAKRYIKKLRVTPVRWHGRKYTYYTSRMLPIWRLPVKGIHLDKNGMWCDQDDYIVLGSSIANKKSRRVFSTPFGKYGKVYDTGGWSTPAWLCDTAVNW